MLGALPAPICMLGCSFHGLLLESAHQSPPLSPAPGQSVVASVLVQLELAKYLT